ncbi:haloacid dehalogenase-like hydrolase [Vibrio sp. S17_S38]|uniref:HAD family hydrolase n=1 Tax=Vibrio sp. S17_S38 TaxID=2720229 RepID=UPI001680B5D0|nr:HAD family hydrolase [Vibrio sp. S17_S38]MBD1571999.1 haloacid dehalogenase-like hydrolase [Vibrio sp. S17_S38]
MKFLRILSVVLVTVISHQVLASTEVDPLPSWNDTAAKKSIIQYVQQTTTPDSKQFIPVSDRIATFDNDGTLWAEKPVYFQLYFALEQIKEKANQHPEWKTEEPFASVLKGDLEGIKKSGMEGLMKIVMASHAGMSSDDFDAAVQAWIKTARHPNTKRPFTEMVYQPMIELLHYLQDNDFKTYIVSGGGVDFMRAWASEVYGIPKEQILGSSLKQEYKVIDGKPTIMRLAEINVNNDKAQKPLSIQTYIGKKPVFAAGNSDGDLEMLQWTKSSSYSSFALLIHHTDEKREWAYDKNSSVGHLEKALPLAKKDNWNVVDMKQDWKQIFAD